MPAPPRIRGSRWTRVRPWAQTSFLDAAPGGPGEGSAPQELEEALGVADCAEDTSRRRDALNRLYDSLAQRAMRRGRTPVPKRRDSQQR